MRSIFLVLFLCSCSEAPCKIEPSAKYDCEEGHLPLSQNKLVVDYSKDTLCLSNFDELTTNLYTKISSGIDLTVEEDKKVVKVINTLFWVDFDSSILVNSNLKSAKHLQHEFDIHYYKVLRCKYHPYAGVGLSVIFKELEIQYTGHPGVNSRYIVVSDSLCIGSN